MGIGPGDREYILPAAEKIINASDIIIGFERAIESLNYILQKKIIIKSLKEILNYIYENPSKSIAIAASGDPCFYGITEFIRNNYNGNVQVIPGLSSFQYMMAKINKSWQGAHLGSMHGRNQELIERVRENKVSIWLTDKTNSPNNICSELIKSNVEAYIYVGENLSYADERIIAGDLEQIATMKFKELCVMCIENLKIDNQC